jgi:haloacid dehalogenase-like hydrolase
MVERMGGRNKTSDAAEAAPARRQAASAKSSSAYTKKTIALVYDFDGTLSPKPMQEYAFLPKLGVKAEDFWAECTRVAKAERADPLITYMHLMYKKAKEKGLRVDRKDLVAQGRDVELYPGVESWFADVGAYVKERSAGHGVTLKHYLVSSGLTEIIEGTKIYKNFANVFASEYWFDAYDLPFPKRVITDTGKTQYLFRINKGIEDLGESINSHMPEDARPIPFSNMIYFGDGDTDVPSMALLKKNGGHAIAVHTPPSQPRRTRASGRSSAADTAAHGGEKKCIDLFNAGRCDFYAPADYRKGSDLYKRTCLLLDRMIADIRVQEERSELG